MKHSPLPHRRIFGSGSARVAAGTALLLAAWLQAAPAAVAQAPPLAAEGPSEAGADAATSDASRSDALTLDDVIALTTAGVAEPVILEAIRAHGSVFSLTTEDLLRASQAGVTANVILAMQRSGHGPVTCANDAECPQNQICRIGRCTKFECYSDSDCGYGSDCMAGRCERRPYTRRSRRSRRDRDYHYETVTGQGIPGMWIPGIPVFLVSYVANGAIAESSADDLCEDDGFSSSWSDEPSARERRWCKDKSLTWIPLVGPFIGAAMAPEEGTRTLLAVFGTFELVGATLLILGSSLKRKVRRRVYAGEDVTPDQDLEIAVVPGVLGPSAVGLTLRIDKF